MSARDVLRRLEGAGVNVEPTTDGRLRFFPQSNVDEELRSLMRTHKGEILRLLTASLGGSEEFAATPATPATPAIKADTYGESSSGSDSGSKKITAFAPATLPPLAQREKEQASELGLVARFSYQFGYVAIHDPTTGEWHDLPTKDAPAWARDEAFKRKELKKYHGISRLLTRAELEEAYRKERERVEQAEGEEGIVEDAGAVDERGVVYEDYLG